ncbi:MAG: amino acid permease [Planctomycetota bacterium]
MGVVGVFCIVSGAMISSGLFVLPGAAFEQAGAAVIISYLLAAIFALPTLFSIAELVTAMPKAGGDYFYITRSMGPLMGTVGGLSSWLALGLKGAFALVGMGAYLGIFLHVPYDITAVIVCAIFIVMNIIGVKEAKVAQIIMVFVLIGILLFYSIYGIEFVNVAHLAPFNPYGMKAVFSTAGLIFISYGGLTAVASIAEEVKNPNRSIPIGMIVSLFVVGIIYVLTVFVTVGVLEPDKLKGSLTPISDGAEVLFGEIGVIIITLAAILACVTTANAALMSASRYPMAMSRDGIFPAAFQRVTHRFGTPSLSVLTTGLFMICTIAFLELTVLIKVASTLFIVLFMFANLTVMIMRESKILNYRPKFRSPFYPVVQLAGIGGSVFLLVEMGTLPLLLSGIFLFSGFLWHWFYVRGKSKREFALIHIIERITDKKLTTYTLEDELMAIIRERESVIEDRFDGLVRKSPVLDLEGKHTVEEFFRKAADALSVRLEIDSETLYNQFIEREKDSHTVMRHDLAIPHIVIEGTQKFDILLARCKDGIIFSESAPCVQIVFALIGTKDERNFHLRTLAAIAQISQKPHFDEHWLNARNIEELRDVVLLGERRR